MCDEISNYLPILPYVICLVVQGIFFFKSRSIRICSNQDVTIDIAMAIAANLKPLLDTYNLRAESKFYATPAMFRDLGFTVLSAGPHQLRQARGTKYILTQIPIRPFTCKNIRETININQKPNILTYS